MGKKTCIFGGVMAMFGYVGTWLGFTTTGVASGSVAALIQGWIGNVAAGSMFATLTSWGMLGVFSFASVFGLTIFSIGLIGSLFKKKEKPKTFGEKVFSFYNDSKEKTRSFYNYAKDKSQPYIKTTKEKSVGFFSGLFNT